MNAPVPASIKMSAVVAGAGHGCGVAVYGPHEDGWKVPERRTAQTGVSAAATAPPPASAPYLESVTESTLTVVDDPICSIAVAVAASAEIAAAVVATVRSGVEAGPRPTQPTRSTIKRIGTEARISAPSWNVFCTDASWTFEVPVTSGNGLWLCASHAQASDEISKVCHVSGLGTTFCGSGKGLVAAQKLEQRWIRGSRVAPRVGSR